MPSKLILNLHELSHASEVLLQTDGSEPVKLNRVKRVTLTADAEDGPPTVELCMYSPDFQGEVLISDWTAEAIALHERRRALEFLDDKDAGYILELRHTLVRVLEWPEDDSRLKPIDKIIAELAKREEIPF